MEALELALVVAVGLEQVEHHLFSDQLCVQRRMGLNMLTSVGHWSGRSWNWLGWRSRDIAAVAHSTFVSTCKPKLHDAKPLSLRYSEQVRSQRSMHCI